MAMLTMAILTTAMLTMATLTMAMLATAMLTMATLTMAMLTMATLTTPPRLLAPRRCGEAYRVDIEVEGGGDAVDELLTHLGGGGGAMGRGVARCGGVWGDAWGPCVRRRRESALSMAILRLYLLWPYLLRRTSSERMRTTHISLSPWEKVAPPSTPVSSMRNCIVSREQ
eukprot:scaffold72858_cov55-Phaeocystis_antarctica.AAC.5